VVEQNLKENFGGEQRTGEIIGKQRKDTKLWKQSIENTDRQGDWNAEKQRSSL